MLEKMEGVVIRTQDYGETHKIVNIFSKKAGKFSAIARGAKKPKSRMAAVTQPFIYGEFLVYFSSGLSTIQQGEVINSLRVIREDIVKTAYAAYIMELTDKLLEPKDPDAFIYNQLSETLEWISEHEDADIPVIMYEMKLYKKGGIAPVLTNCASCGNRETPFSFSTAEGGMLCSRCLHQDPHAPALPDTIAKWLPVMADTGLERIGTIRMKTENKQLLRNIMDHYYDQYGGYFLKSRKFIHDIDLLK